MSLFSLAMVLTGFARSFYLYNYFEFPELPVHLIVHGAVLTLWFTLACVQPLLIEFRHAQHHRWLGVSGLFIAVAVVVTGVWTLVVRDAPDIDEYPTGAGPNLASLFMFISCLALGYWFRHQSAKHKRLMLMASLPILSPALDRIARIPFLNEPLGKALYWFPAPPEIAFASIAFLFLILLVIAHDLYSERKVHSGTIWGLVALLVFAPLAATILVSTNVWANFVRLVA